MLNKAICERIKINHEIGTFTAKSTVRWGFLILPLYIDFLSIWRARVVSSDVHDEAFVSIVIPVEWPVLCEESTEECLPSLPEAAKGRFTQGLKSD